MRCSPVLQRSRCWTAPDSAYAAVIPKFVDLLVNQQPPSINGDGLQTRDFVHVNDVVRAIFKFLEPNWAGANFHVFNVAIRQGYRS